MRFGIAIFLTDEAADPATIARLVEELGFESLFFPEHTHIPAGRRTPYPPGGELPREYSRTYDPFVALTAAAAATSKLLIGTGICLVIERDPIITAKEVASLDRLSDGRFLFGVGAGWNIEEMENHGTDPRRRISRCSWAETRNACSTAWSPSATSGCRTASPASPSGSGSSSSSPPTRDATPSPSLSRAQGPTAS